MEGQVNKVIDQAAGIAKDKIGQAIGGKPKTDKKQEGGVGNMVSDVMGKAAAKHATDQAADQALAFGKKFLG